MRNSHIQDPRFAGHPSFISKSTKRKKKKKSKNAINIIKKIQ